MIERLHEWADIVFALAIVLACIQMADRVGRATRWVMRLSVFGLMVGSLAQIFGGWLAFGEWPLTLQLGSTLVFILANMRDPIAIPSATWSNRAAWLAAGGLALVLGATAAQAFL